MLPTDEEITTGWETLTKALTAAARTLPRHTVRWFARNADLTVGFHEDLEKIAQRKTRKKPPSRRNSVLNTFMDRHLSSLQESPQAALNYGRRPPAAGIRQRRRPVTGGDLARLRAAEAGVRGAIVLLKEAGAYHATARVQAAVKSVIGARKHAEGEGLMTEKVTDPYGSMSYGYHHKEDGIWFDFGLLPDDKVRIHSVLNVDSSAHFIEDFACVDVHRADALTEAQRQIDLAVNWFFDNHGGRYVGLRSMKKFLRNLERDARVNLHALMRGAKAARLADEARTKA